MTTKNSLPCPRSLTALATGCILLGACGQADDVDSPEAAAAVPAHQQPVRVQSRAELQRMEAHAASLYDRGDVHHSFSLPSGDTIDCVDILRQPGLRRPGMKQQGLLQPPVLPESPKPSSTPGTALAEQEAFLTGGKDPSGAERKCPQQTIPIRRVTIEEMQRFRTLGDFHRKVPSHLSEQLDGPIDPSLLPAGPTAEHQYAHAAQFGVTNYGSRSILNIWSPFVDTFYASNEFSLSQTWVVNGSIFDHTLESLEVGAQGYPSKYGDNSARLFIFSTSDGYSGDDYSSGCYNLDCGRFVQTSDSVVFGGRFSSYSIAGGLQTEMDVTWFRGGTPAAWWLYIGGQPVGYYPLDLFDSRGVYWQATGVDFGGEVIDQRSRHAWHTTTRMGSSSGDYPSAGFGRAAYQRNLIYFDTPLSVAVPRLNPMRDNPYCYDISPIKDTPAWGKHFFFGGPGYNTSCL